MQLTNGQWWKRILGLAPQPARSDAATEGAGAKQLDKISTDPGQRGEVGGDVEFAST
jgi:hypothetical protein